MKDLVEKMNEKPLSGYPNKLAEGEMEQIERDIKSREHDEKVYYTRFMFAFLGILLLVMLVHGDVENAGSVKVLDEIHYKACCTCDSLVSIR